MFDRDKWQEIWGTMRKHKLRTGLTAFGVFWGIFMLVFILGMGAGLENGVFRNFGDRAKNVMYVWSNRTSLPYQGFQPGRYPRLVLDDIEAIKQQIPEVEYIAPRRTIGQQTIIHGEKSEKYEVRGELWDMLKLEPLKLFEGRYLKKGDFDEGRKVAVIGQKVKDVLFGEKNAVGEYIRIQGVEFMVVGIFGPVQIKPWTEDEMESVVIPLSTMNRAFGGNNRGIDFFICSAAPDVRVSEMEPKVKALLKARHHVAPDDPRGIGGFNLEEEYMTVRNLFTGIKAFLWFVGIGTLLAGIVGVSNIMLIVVKERTKEIGIRKALGATPRSIISMILTESIFLTAASGYAGLIVGTGLIAGIDYIMKANNIESENFYHPEVQLMVGIGAVVVLVLAGTVAGLIPASMAARVNPVVALKDE